jgi:hypothetical protein
MSTQSTGYHYESRHQCGAWRGTLTRDDGRSLIVLYCEVGAGPIHRSQLHS